MKSLGLTAQKPLYQAWAQDEKLVPQWKEDLYPEMLREGLKRQLQLSTLQISWE